MLRWLVACLTLLAAVSAAFCGERKEPFDEYIYHAPQLDGIVCDGDPSDWPEWLPWEAIDHQWECDRSCCWPTDWNRPPTGPDDISARFRAGWSLIENWPVLYLLVEWHDDEFHLDPEGAWNTTDMLMLALGENLYDYDQPLYEEDGWRLCWGQDSDCSTRCMEVRPSEESGVRITMGPTLVSDENQPLTKAAWRRTEESGAYVECQVQLFKDYGARTAWQLTPGASCLAFSFGEVADYDPGDGSFTYLTWGRFEPCWHYDIRVAFSTIAFEPADYWVAVESTTWGAIKSGF